MPASSSTTTGWGRLSKAAKKAGRVAAEGLIGVDTAGKSGAVVEVNSETDFVARNEQFQDMVLKIASLAAKAKGDVAKLLAMTYPGKDARGASGKSSGWRVTDSRRPCD